MKKCCDTCIHKKVCDYWEKEAHPDDYGTYDGEPCIDYFPADVAPVVHGEWRFWDGWRGNHDQRIEDATCSECGYVHPTVRREHNDKSYKDVLGRLANYCPNCGTRMDGGSKNGTM